MRTWILATAGFVCLGIASCGSDRESPATSDAHEGHDHALAEAAESVPDHEGEVAFCEEHGVPEATCAICLPSVAAALLHSGEMPRSGGPLVRLASKQAASKAGLRTVPAAEAGGGSVATALAKTVFDSDRFARISSPAPATVEKILVDLGQRVRAGDPLVVLSSAEIAGRRGALAAARAREGLALAEAERVRSMRGQDLASQRDLDAVERELEAARAERVAEEQGLRALLRAGSREAGAADAGEGAATSDSHVIHAPISGIVVAREALPGSVVETDATILEIADPSRLWLELEVREEEALLVRPGQAVRAMFDALPGAAIEGRITGVSSAVDPHTRFLLARAVVENPDGLLKANLYGRAVIDLGASGRGAVAAVPRDAVQFVEEVPVLFVYVADDLYEIRPARTGMQRDGRVEILSGVAPGERVVTDGAFLLKTQVSKGSIGAGCCDVVETLGRRR